MQPSTQTYDSILGALVARRSSVAEIARRAQCSPTWARMVLCGERDATGPKSRRVVSELTAVLGYNPLAGGRALAMPVDADTRREPTS